MTLSSHSLKRFGEITSRRRTSMQLLAILGVIKFDYLLISYLFIPMSHKILYYSLGWKATPSGQEAQDFLTM